MNIYTFEYYWSQFHLKTKQKKLNKNIAYQLWENINDLGLQKKIILEIDSDYKLDGYRYLKDKLNGRDKRHDITSLISLIPSLFKKEKKNKSSKGKARRS